MQTTSSKTGGMCAVAGECSAWRNPEHHGEGDPVRVTPRGKCPKWANPERNRVDLCFQQLGRTAFLLKIIFCCCSFLLERQRDRVLSSISSLSKSPQRQGLGQVEAGNAIQAHQTAGTKPPRAHTSRKLEPGLKHQYPSRGRRHPNWYPNC